MKIVINKCYGGFGLSPAAVKRYAELNGKECYFFNYDLDNMLADGKQPCTIEKASQTMMFMAYSVPNPYEVAGSQANFVELSMEERMASNASWDAITIDNSQMKRNDPKLIQVVEELGDAAGDKYAKLKIVEIPDGIQWEISEYDGMETVEEAHRSWY